MSPLRHTTVMGWAFALALAVSIPAGADDVVLKNGNSFDGVIVLAESDDSVRIRLAYGEMSLPRSWVERIDREESPLGGYLSRRADLRGRPDAGVEEWLELARWARGRELRHGFKEAVEEAALIRPRHPEVARLLRGLGYVYEEAHGVWISPAERRRAEAEEAERLRAAEVRARRAEARDEGLDRETERTLSRAIEALALAELERETRTSEREAAERTQHPFAVGGYGAPIYPVTYYAGTPSRGPAPRPGTPAPRTPPTRDPYASVRSRLPASLLVSRSPSGGRMSSQSRPHLPGSLLQSRPR